MVLEARGQSSGKAVPLSLWSDKRQPHQHFNGNRMPLPRKAVAENRKIGLRDCPLELRQKRQRHLVSDPERRFSASPFPLLPRRVLPLENVHAASLTNFGNR